MKVREDKFKKNLDRIFKATIVSHIEKSIIIHTNTWNKCKNIDKTGYKRFIIPFWIMIFLMGSFFFSNRTVILQQFLIQPLIWIL